MNAKNSQHKIVVFPIFLKFLFNMVQKEGNLFAFLAHSKIVGGHNGQAKKDGTTFASWDTSKESQEHQDIRI